MNGNSPSSLFRTPPNTKKTRYSDGRKAWATLTVQSRNLARYFWIHIDEREGDQGKDDILTKLYVSRLSFLFHTPRPRPHALTPT
jgi:predicted membrane chloride channel (bestrophin family)